MPALDSPVVLLKAHPVFSAWPKSLINKLAAKMFRTHYAAGEIIVHEGELVDSLYFIVDGIAEVLRRDELYPQENVVIATLRQGETIGFSATGLYSTTGKRTATVKAVKKIELYGIKIETLHDFLRHHPELQSNLAEITTRIWKMQMVKQAAPFAVLNMEQLQWLADKVEEVETPSDTVLFSEGESGDSCYLITVGSINLIKNNEIITTIESPALFGETALLMNMPRTATARTITPVQLLRLKREDLLNIVQQEKITLKLLSRMEKERSSPSRKPGIIIHQTTTATGEFIVTLKNPENYAYYQLSAEGWFVWQMLDGKHSVKEIALAFEKEFQLFSASLIISLIANLARAGFVDFHDREGFTFVTEVKLPLWMRFVEGTRKVMEAEYPFPQADAWITKTFNSFVKIFYTKPVIFLLLFIAVVGIGSFIFLTQHIVPLLPHTPHMLLLIILVDLAAIISIPLHELAHAYTTKYFGHEVHHFGVGWYWIGPMAFTDTTDMWLSSKWPRISVNIAGMFIDAVIASLLTLFAWLSSTNEVAVFFWLFAMFCYLSIFHNLYPLIELDGYYTLMDLFERPSLREDAVEWLVEASPKFTREYRFEIIYWFICLCFIVASPFVAWFVQQFVLIYIFPILAHGYWRFLLPLIAVFLSLLSVYVEIQRHKREEQED